MSRDSPSLDDLYGVGATDADDAAFDEDAMTLTDDEVDAIRHAVACDRHDYGRGMAFDESEHVPDMIRAGFAAGLAAIPREPIGGHYYSIERMQAIVDAAVAWRNGTGTRHALILLVQAYTPEEP